MRNRWIAAERIRRGRAVHWSAVFTFACALPLACGKVLGIEQPNHVGNTQGGAPAAAGDGGDDGRGGTAGTAKGGTAGSGAQDGGAGATTDGGAAGSWMGGE